MAAVVMQMCLGATYAWSVFVLPPKQMTGIFQSTAQLPFSLFYFAFPAAMMVTGTLLPKIGPRRCALIGGLFFGGGWLLAALGRFHFGLTILGIGLLAGIGVGFADIVPIAAGMAFDRLGSFDLVLWTIGALMLGSAFAVGCGLRLNGQEKVDFSLNQKVENLSTRFN